MKKEVAMRKDLSGIYRTHWAYLGTFHEGVATIFHSPNDIIIGFEVCMESDNKYGGLYILQGKRKGAKIMGLWWKSDTSQHGNFSLTIDHKQLKGCYDHLHDKKITKEGRFNYNFNYLRGI